MALTDKYGLDSHERDQRKKFVHLSDEDISALQELRPWLEKHVDRIVEDFYVHLLTYKEARAFFSDVRTLAHVKAAQRDYLLDLFRGTYDEGYFERRLQIGVVHERIGLAPKWYVGSNSNFFGLLVPLLEEKYLFRRRKFVRAVLALTKVMNLDQQLVIDTYIGSLVDKLQEKQKPADLLLKDIQEGVSVLASSSSEILATTTQVAAEQGNKAVEAGVKQSADAAESIRLLADSVAEAGQTLRGQVPVLYPRTQHPGGREPGAREQSAPTLSPAGAGFGTHRPTRHRPHGAAAGRARGMGQPTS